MSDCSDFSSAILPSTRDSAAAIKFSRKVSCCSRASSSPRRCDKDGQHVHFRGTDGFAVIGRGIVAGGGRGIGRGGLRCRRGFGARLARKPHAFDDQKPAAQKNDGRQQPQMPEQLLHRTPLSASSRPASTAG